MTGWFEDRFRERSTAVKTACQTCCRDMWLPRSKVERYKTCGGDCAFGPVKARVAARTRPCATCGEQFTPRNNQAVGLYCSQKCNVAGQEAITAPETLARGQATRREKIAAGIITFPVGDEHHSWKGGKEAQKERRRPKERRWLQEYRKKNPHKVREWKQRRDNGKVLPRLPWGTIPRLGEMQRWRCAICRVSVKSGYHLDHIMPIARGGKHEPRNLQLLCQSCNVRKNAKDPIDYMRQIGRLL